MSETQVPLERTRLRRPDHLASPLGPDRTGSAWSVSFRDAEVPVEWEGPSPWFYKHSDRIV